MWSAFPTSDYYGGSVPIPSRQLTIRLPTRCCGPAEVRAAREGSHVHYVPVDRIGAQLYPGSIATPTPQAFGVASQPAYVSRRRSRLILRRFDVHYNPAHIHQI
jgi:hypothetical protein